MIKGRLLQDLRWNSNNKSAVIKINLTNISWQLWCLPQCYKIYHEMEHHAYINGKVEVKRSSSRVSKRSFNMIDERSQSSKKERRSSNVLSLTIGSNEKNNDLPNEL